MPTPRFVNPHFLPESSTLVSRKDIYCEGDDTEGDEEIHLPDPELIERLNTLIRKSCEQPEERSKKRRKTQVESPPLVEDESGSIPFRLVSSSAPPHPILLRPKSPPPPVTREPETEDNEAQAALRMERAQAVAVDASRILIEPPTPTTRPGHAKKVIPATGALPASLPTIMIVEYDKPSRSTRPPVPATLLNHHPYNHGSVLTTEPSARSMECLLIQANLSLSTTPTSTTATTKRKRRRGKMLRKERPPPAFWRPNPAVRGKSLGYAMGFPCSLDALRNGDDKGNRYPRDTMKNWRLPS
ncbi:hypothetical protein LshimejAT787_0804220 [Lyophyllum shimeji]|uniref:Uncharacterized protein n=1 Tax=Lyophyllum shimeji TaxID=47721 RepID=A0A9P3PRT7_LYOSH|nr:hypothetical protein LshimejAT787_0804220 [Lyophyllum shimeji]